MNDLYRLSWEAAGYPLTDDELDLLFQIGVQADMKNVHIIISVMRQSYDLGYQDAEEDDE